MVHGILTTKLGGTDITDGSVLYSADLVDTFDAGSDTFTELNKQKYGDSSLSGCLIEEQAVPDQTAKMSAGKVLIGGLYYLIALDASIAFTNADGSNPRYDLVSVDTAGTVTVTDGTAAATPVMPSLPTDDNPIAYVYRAASDNIVGTADITDCRRIIGESYYYSDNTFDSNSTGATQTEKTVTIPAYRIQKKLKITFDVSGWLASYYDGWNTDATAYVYAYLYIDSDLQGTLQGLCSKEYYGSQQFITVAGQTATFIFDSADLDFTKPLLIEIKTIGIDGWSNALNIGVTTHGLLVEGE